MKSGQDDLVPVPRTLPPIEGLKADEFTSRRSRYAWLWTLLAALAVVVLVVFVIALGVRGIYDGLRDRAVANRQLAQEHYALGIKHLEAGEYELAVAEFELAQRQDPDLPDLATQLERAQELAGAQAVPTSETRRDAAVSLYRQAVAHYEKGNLEEAVTTLVELRGLDADYQRKNVETMLATAHYQLGLNALREDRLDDATEQFEAVLGFTSDASTKQNAQAQLDLLNLYKAALSHWQRDWTATIQTLKGLYALAPDYKDVQTRLHDAYVFRAQEYADQGDWCHASEEYAAAAVVFPLEDTVDRRDDAAIQCQLAAEAPTPSPTSPGRAATATPSPTPKATAGGASTGITLSGRIVYPRFDAIRQTHDLYLIELSQKADRLLRENASQPSFSPDSKRLAFRNLDPSHLGISILGLRDSQLIEVTSHAEDSMPTWSPDASQIAFASNKHGDRKWRIYAISPGAVHGEGDEWVLGQTPAWSPDGSDIAYHGCDARGNNCGLLIMEPGGFDQTRLTTDPSDTIPEWSPDGTNVAFMSSRAGNWELYVVDVPTGKERRMTNHPAADVAPTWSPDGRRLAFLSNREGGWAVYVLDVKSGRVQKVIDTGDPYPDPVDQRLAWIP